MCCMLTGKPGWYSLHGTAWIEWFTDQNQLICVWCWIIYEYLNIWCVSWPYSVVQNNIILHKSSHLPGQNTDSCFNSQKTPHITLTGELRSISHEDFSENWPCYNSTTLYIVFAYSNWMSMVEHCQTLNSQQTPIWYLILMSELGSEWVSDWI